MQWLVATPSRVTLLAGTTIVLAAVLAYQNSFAGVFILDDQTWIVDNPTIRQLWPIRSWLIPRQAALLGGRPVIALTLAINYALGGTNVWGYHAVNLAIHVLAALTLFGVLRRTLTSPSLRDRFGSAATSLALAVAILWTVHPLQTQAVTYIIQRCESLVALFYLLTLYCVIRGAASSRPALWSIAAFAACLFGMASKEVMVTAPIVVLLYDRTFLSGSFRSALRARYRLYLALAATWGVVVLLLLSTGFYGGSTGFTVKKFTWWSYLLTQSGVLTHYLRLAFWPTGLCLDYGWPAARTLAEIVPPSLLIAGLLGLTGWGLVKRPAVGFLGAWFFLILAPSSSIVPILDAAFEHRMYLPLAAVVMGVVVGGYLAGRWLIGRGVVSLRAAQIAGVCLAAFAGTALGILTFHRNADYASALWIWQDAVAKMPNNPRAHYNLGTLLNDSGQTDEAISHFYKVLEVDPNYVAAHYNLGNALAECSRYNEAVTQYKKALDIEPASVDAHNNLGNALAACGRVEEAVVHYRACLELDPNSVNAHYNLAVNLAACGRAEEAVTHYLRALELKPDYAEAHHNLANLLAALSRFNEAVAEYREALKLKPGCLEAYNNLAVLLATCPEASIRNGAEAVALAQRAVELSGGRDPIMLDALAAAYAEAGRFADALRTARQAVDLAARQNKAAVANSIQAKIPLYEAGTPFRQTLQLPAKK
jgi:Flp pilus assembly protein TadD